MGPISPETNPWDSPIDSCRPIKVICIGAGISGILAGIRFPQRIKNLDFTIYEKNIDVGGTWFENRYPGLGPDFSCHAYQYTFASNPNWSRFYPPGKEIQEYLQGVARKYNVKKYIRFAHLFKSAEWLEESGKWEITLERLCDKEVIKDHADVLLKATGLLNTWHWPDISGLHDFKGKLLHSADWDESYNPNNGTVAVIGYGPSGMQIIPALQPLVKSMQCYVRGKSWIAQYGPGADELKERGGGDNFEHSIEEIRQFNENPETYLQFRHKVEGALNKAQFVTFRGTEANKAFSEATDKWMKDALVKRPDIYESLKPDYPVACRRLFPGSRFLEALIRDNVEFIPKEIKHITTTGIEDEDGVFRKADTIICATGFDPPLNANESPIIGKGGTTLSQIWDPSPSAYLSMCPEKMPNFYIFLGPNSVPSAGSTIYMIESYCEYMIKCVQKLQRERLKSMTISAKANAAWIKQVDRYFSRTAFTYACKSWAKSYSPMGRVIAVWPGSSVHARFAMDSPRWEDFEYEYLDAGAGGREGEGEGDSCLLAWMGNGMTRAQECGGRTTGYLDLDEVDVPLPVMGTGLEID